MKAKNKTAWPLYALILVFLHVVSAAGGPLEDAEAAIKRRDYTTAARIIRPLAESGDATAQYNLGVFYDKALVSRRTRSTPTCGSAWRQHKAEKVRQLFETLWHGA
jgi:TPR repeat protein